MGLLYRFVEPVILLLLLQKGEAHGYELANELPRYALTDAEVETAALYRTLRTLEHNGNVTSRWLSNSPLNQFPALGTLGNCPDKEIKCCGATTTIKRSSRPRARKHVRLKKTSA
jgi:hypothetical protein